MFIFGLEGDKDMDRKMNLCLNFFYELASLLGSDYSLVGSCNRDKSVYLVPKGTEKDISYYGKPNKSFRVSDHWNWYANINKCKKEQYIQCWSVDVPYPRQRKETGKPTKPRKAAQVSIIGPDGKYHVVYGEKWNKNKKTWTWIDTDPATVITEVFA